MFSRSSFVVFLALSLFVQATPYHFPFHRSQQSGQNLCENKPQATRTVVQTVTVTAKPTQQVGGNNQVRPVVPPGINVSPTSASQASKTTSRGNATNTSSIGKGNNNNGDGKGGNERNNTGGGKGGNNGGNNGGNGGNNNNGGGGNNNNNDPQKSFTLDPRVISHGFEQNGQDPPVTGQVASLTSGNNFINFCLTVSNLPLTNGKQVQSGSCNTAPIGVIPSVDNMPSSKFSFPDNFGTIKAGETFTIEMNIKNMQTGFFVNAQANYFGAPQQLNDQGQIKGHSHVVIEKIESFQQKTPTNPKVFVFFKGLNAAAQGGKLTASVDKGLEPGFYKLSSINTSSNHQPVIVPVAQHGSLDDAIYFTVTADGKPLNNQGNGSANGGNGANNGKDNNNGGNNGAHNGGNKGDDANGGKSATTTANGGAAATSASTSGKAGATPTQQPNNNGGSSNQPTDQGKQGGDNKQGGNNGSDNKPGENRATASSPPAGAAPTPAQNGKGGKLRRRMVYHL